MPDYVPSYEGVRVEFGKGDFSSSLKAIKTFEDGDVIAGLERATRTSTKDYSTLQCGATEDDHLSLNSDLLYVNHSCDPNVVFDLSSQDPSEWVLRAVKRITPGETVTFFYPSTEWDMGQPFDCGCGSQRCLGRIQGAAYLDRTVLSQYWLNPWIQQLARNRG